MASKSRSLLFAFLSILALSILNQAASKGALLGGWQPIKNLKDPEVVDIAKFAVAEHNKQANTKLKFVGVVKGEYQVVSGMNYRLDISAKDGGASAPKTYRAQVYSKSWEKLQKLESFVEIKG